LAFAIISGVISTPITRPVFPTFCAARNASNPAPDPRSSTTSPSWIAEKATGLPHPNPRFAPSGTAFMSASLYPTFLLITFGWLTLPQQEPDEQHPAFFSIAFA